MDKFQGSYNVLVVPNKSVYENPYLMKPDELGIQAQTSQATVNITQPILYTASNQLLEFENKQKKNQHLTQHTSQQTTNTLHNTQTKINTLHNIHHNKQTKQHLTQHTSQL